MAIGFVNEAMQDYHLSSGSQCVNASGDPSLNPAVLPDNNVVLEYVKHQMTTPRTADGVYDIGAYEFAARRRRSIVTSC